MITVSADYEASVAAPAREFKAYVYDDSDMSYIYDDDDLKRLKISVEGDWFRTVMRMAEFEFYESHDYLGKDLNLAMGIVLSSGASIGTPEYIDYGTFTAVKVEDNKEEQYSRVYLYDLMYQSLKEYKPLDVTYPLTLKAFLEAICTELGWTLGTSSFHNDSLSITADLFALQGLTYRDVLDRIAEVTGTVMYFDTSDELILKDILTSSLETVGTDKLNKLSVEKVFGAVDSFVISEEPGDFYYNGGYYNPTMLMQDGSDMLMQDGSDMLMQVLLEEDTFVQIRFENNPILLEDPSTLVDPLAGEINGLSYYPFEAYTTFLGYFEIGDYITVQDRSSNNFVTYVMGFEIEVGDQGNYEMLFSRIPEKSRSKFLEQIGGVRDLIARSELDTRNYKDESITSAKINSLTADKITTGSLTAVATVGGEDGSASVVIDGEENRIVITDEDGNPRILIGKQTGGF